MNIRGIHAIYRYEMNRSFRTLIQSLVSPVLSTILILSLYLVLQLDHEWIILVMFLMEHLLYLDL